MKSHAFKGNLSALPSSKESSAGESAVTVIDPPAGEMTLVKAKRFAKSKYKELASKTSMNKSSHRKQLEAIVVTLGGHDVEICKSHKSQELLNTHEMLLEKLKNSEQSSQLWDDAHYREKFEEFKQLSAELLKSAANMQSAVIELKKAQHEDNMEKTLSTATTWRRPTMPACSQ